MGANQSTRVLVLALFFVVLFGAALAVPCGAHAQDDAGSDNHQGLNLSLFWPTATNSDPMTTATVRVSLLYGRLGAVRGFDLNGVVARTHGEMKGVQITGAYSRTDGDLTGAAFTLGANYVQGDVHALQATGGVNYVTGYSRGLQGAGLLNFTVGGFSGFQVAGVFNLNEGTAAGVQISSMANLSVGDMHGLQLASFVNVAGLFHGLQVGTANMVGELHGAQAGVLNFARASSGFQVGAFNWTQEENQGVPIGLVNLAENGNVDVIVYGSNLSAVNAGVRTEVNRWYSMLTMGWGNVLEDPDDTFFITWNFGREFPVSERWKLGADLGLSHMMPKSQADPAINDKIRPAFQLRGLVDVRLSRTISVFGGGGGMLVLTEYGSDAESSFEPLVFAGVSLF